MSDHRSYDNFSEKAIYNGLGKAATGEWNGWRDDFSGNASSTPITAENLNAMLNMLIYIRNFIGKTDEFATDINGSTAILKPDTNLESKSVATYIKEVADAIIGTNDDFNSTHPTLKGMVETIGLIPGDEEGHWNISFGDSTPDPTPDPGPAPDPGPTPPSTPVKLVAPVVTVSNTGVASWAAVTNAQSYKYKINGGHEGSTDTTSVQLASGDSIIVKAVGDGTAYTDSDFSEAVTYTSSEDPDTPIESDEADNIISLLETNPIIYDESGFNKLDSNPQDNTTKGYWKEDSNTVILQHYEVLGSIQLYEIEIPQSILDNYTITIQQYDAITTHTWGPSTYKLTPVEGKDNTYNLKSSSSYRPSVIEIRFKISKKENI